MIKVSEPIVGEREVAAVSEVLLSGRYVQGPKVAEFEGAFADYVGAEHGVAVATGTAALHISLAAYGIGPGDEVIVPPLTFFSTVTSVLHQNAIPIFADIQDDNYCLDPSDVARCITDRTKAIIPVHLYGHPAEMDKLMMVAEEYGLLVIEDCAQAHGAKYHGSRVGSIGQAGCFSFYATKNMTTGEGGIIVTDDEDIANRCRLIRSHGMSDRDTHAILGFNYRMTDMAGAMGIVQLDRLDELNALRVKNSEYLLNGLNDISWLRVPSIPDYVEHVYFWCPVQIREDVLGMDTKDFVSLLRKNNVEVRHRYSEPLYRQLLLTDSSLYPLCCDHYRDAPDYGSLSLPVVESVAGKMIGLPNHPGLSLADMDKVLEVFHQI
tara:strand:- start:185 stop:1321 length:1137 start_codon:yes stop_codon:yes gene_type:complete